MRVRVEGRIDGKDKARLKKIWLAVEYFGDGRYGKEAFLKDALGLSALSDIHLEAEPKLRENYEWAFDRYDGYTVFYAVNASFENAQFDKAMQEIRELCEVIESGQIIQLARLILEKKENGRRSWKE